MRNTTVLALILGLVASSVPTPQATAQDFRSMCSCGHYHTGICPVRLNPSDNSASDGQVIDNGGVNPQADGAGNIRVTTRWTRTATDFNTGTQGTPVTLTWGFAPDGTAINAQGSGPSSLVSFLDTNVGNPADSGIANLQQKSWFPIVKDAYDRWAEISGLTINYEPNDDGLPISGGGSTPGVLGVRPDLRISGHSIDGGGGILAFNFFPNAGDQVVDTDDVGFYSNPNNNFRALRNVIMHEIGHGLGFSHTDSNNSRQLMEPFINTSFDGPQFDDILSAHFNYGDALEKNGGNDTIGTATTAATLGLFDGWEIGVDGDIPTANTAIGGTDTDFVSIDQNSDVDFYRFTASSEGLLDLRVTPVGPTYNESFQGGTQTPLNTRELSNLSVVIRNERGQAVAVSAAAGLGQAEEIVDLQLTPGQVVFAEIRGVGNPAESRANTQLYRIDAAINPNRGEGTVFDLRNLADDGQQSTTLTEDDFTLNLSAQGTSPTLASTGSGTGVNSTRDIGTTAEQERIDGRAGEALHISFDKDVRLTDIEIQDLNIDTLETFQLSFVSGENPFTDLSGYDGNYSLNGNTLSYNTSEYQSAIVPIVFGVDGQDDLFVKAGTVLSITSFAGLQGGFFVSGITAIAVPEPSAAMLFACTLVGYLGRRRRR